MSGRSMSARRIEKETFFSRLAPRERLMVMLLAAVFFFMAAIVLSALRSTRISAAHEQVTAIREGLDVLRVRGPAYQEKLKGKATRESKIADTPLVFGTLIERAEAAAEISASGQEEKPPTEIEGGLRMRTFEFDLKNVTLDQLTKFLAAVESEPDRVVLAQKLLVRSSSGNEDLLTVQVELATWERVPDPTATEEKL